MARYNSFIIDGEMYQVRHVRNSAFQTMKIYKCNRKNILCKRTLLAAPLLIDMMIEAQNTLDGKADNYYARLAEFSIRKAIAKF